VKEMVPSDAVSLIEVESVEDVECPDCHHQIPNEPNNEEMKLITEEARQRVIKAMKVLQQYHSKSIEFLAF